MDCTRAQRKPVPEREEHGMGQEEQGMGGAANMPPFARESMHREEREEYDDRYDVVEGPPLR
jgi:hypothetical protein